MHFKFKILIVVIFSVGIFTPCYTQRKTIALGSPVIAPSKKPVRSVGKAEVFYDEKQDKTQSQVHIVLSRNIDSSFVLRSQLTMLVGYEVAGIKANEPEFLYIYFTSFSSTGAKYKKNHQISIYTDDKLLLSSDSEVRFSTHYPGQWNESFALPKIQYTDFRKILEAKKIMIQLGETKAELEPDAIEALKDLDKTIEK